MTWKTIKVSMEAYEQAKKLAGHFKFHGTAAAGLPPDIERGLRDGYGPGIGSVVTAALAYFDRAINPRASLPPGQRRAQVARRKRATRRR